MCMKYVLSIIMNGHPHPLDVERVCASRRPYSSIYINSPRPRPRPCHFQRGGRLSRPHWLTTPRPTLSTALAYNAAADSLDRIGLQRRGRLARPHHLTTSRMTRSSVFTAGSRVRASLQRRGRLAVRVGLQTSRPTHPSAPVYHAAAGSPVSDFNFT